MFNIKEHLREERHNQRDINAAHAKYLDRVNELYSSGVCESYFVARQQARKEYQALGYDFR